MVSRTRKIIITSEAKQSRRSIFNYWIKRNKSISYSRKLNSLFNQKFLQIALFPEASIEISKNERMVLVRDYYLIFEFDDTMIKILDIWDTRQNPENFPLK